MAERALASPQPRRSPEALGPVLIRARQEASRPLDTDVQRSLASRIPFDFSRVRVHAGSSSAQAASALGARAFAIGRDVHLSAGARGLRGAERSRLLAHEAVHTAQQGGRPATGQSSLQVGHPHSVAEAEADHIASAVASPDATAMAHEPARVSRVGVQLQRDLVGAYDLTEGRFRINMRTVSAPGGSSGMSGTLSFRPNAAAPDAHNIRMLQIVRVEDTGAGTEHVWTGAEADRNRVQTTGNAARHVDPGFFVDHSAAAAAPRTARADARVSPFYRSYWPNAADSHDGWKHGTNIRSASLWDGPSANVNRRFSFETYAVSARTGGTRRGHVFGGAKWGFNVSNAAAGTVTGERVTYHNRPSSNYYASVHAFDDFYRNPGRSTAP